MMTGVKIISNIGKRKFDKEVNELAHSLVLEAAEIVQRESKAIMHKHRITGETEESIQTRDATKHEYHPRAEAYTAIEHARMLEFHQVPFMRPGARRARKFIRELVKKYFHDWAMKGVVRKKSKGKIGITKSTYSWRKKK